MENSHRDQLRTFSDDILVTMENSEDELSSLPDDILIKILSLLPIKFAVASSVLSRRWINLWTHITAFFDSDESESESVSNLTSISIVDHLLLKLRSPVISTFTLTIDDDSNTRTNPDSVDSWFRFICGRSVQHLKLSYWSDDSFQSLSRLLQCCSLVSLSLCVKPLSLDESPSPCLEEDISEINLPNLKILRIGSLRDCHETLMAKLFKSCPRLEELCIGGLLCNPGVKFHPYQTREVPVFISGQYLRKLHFHFRFDHDAHHRNIVVYIDAPNLQIFKVDDINYLQFRFINKPTGLLKAKLQCSRYDIFSNNNMEWFQVTCGVSELKIGETTIRDVFLLKDRDYQLPIPIFSNLTKLVTSVSTLWGWKTYFFRLLGCTPNLEFLNVTLLFQSYFSPGPDDCTRSFPQAAPSCLVHRVKKMEFEIHGILNCRYRELELEVVKYMLIHARALEELVIKVRCLVDVQRIRRGMRGLDELKCFEEVQLSHFYKNLRDLPRSLGVHCSVTLKVVLYNDIQFVLPYQMEFEDGRAFRSPTRRNPIHDYKAPRITLKESFST